jgi:hypothetical protein
MWELKANKNAVFCDATQYGSCKKRRFGGTTNVVPSSQILFILMMEVLRSNVTLALTTATRRIIPEEDILYSHSRGNVKTYLALTS